MAVMWADDFQGYGNNGAFMLNGLYAEMGAQLVVDPDPDAGGGYVVGYGFQTGSGVGFRRVFPATKTVAGVAFRFWMGSLPAYDQKSSYFIFADAGNNAVISFYPTPTGAIAVNRGGYGATRIGVTPGPVLVANAFNHVEAKVVADATAGSVEIRVNGVSVLTINNINTGADLSQFAMEQHFAVSENFAFYVKDLVAWNGDGTHNHDFIGTVAVLSMWPDGDVSLGGWTPATGSTGFDMINNAPPTDSVDYITAPFPPPPPAEFTLSDLPPTVSTVKALISQVRVRKSDGGDGKVQAALISAGTEADGANRPITTAFTYYEDVFEVDPATGNSWTPAGADNAHLKLNRTL